MSAPDENASRIVLIDGHAQFFRAYYAIRGGMTSPVTKESTNLTFGFISMLLRLLREQPPEYLAVVIDVSGDRETFRSEIYPEYKANRDAAPDDFHPQVERCLEFLNFLKIPVIGVAGVEADDVMATIAKRVHESDDDHVLRIVSRDKDLTQLLNADVEMYDPYKDELVSPSSVFKVEGIEPHHVVDMLTLMGDTVDNVPGVEGIGPKTAAKLILEFGSVDALYERLDEIKGKRKEKLEAAREQIPLSRELVTLRDDVDIHWSVDDARYDPSEIDAGLCEAMFEELGFNRFRSDLQQIMGGSSESAEAKAEADESTTTSAASDGGMPGSLFDMMQDDPPPAEPSGDYRLIATRDELETLIAELRAAGQFAVDTETDGLAAVSANLCGISVAADIETGAYIPTRSPDPSSHLDTETVVELMRPLLEDASLGKIGHHLKFDLNVLRAHGIRMTGMAFDTMIASYVLDATRSSHKMDVLALAMLNHRCIPITDLIGKGKHQRTFDTVELGRAVPYAAEDADITLQLQRAMDKAMDDAQLRTLFNDLEMPLIDVLAEMEYNGILVDADELDRQRERLTERIDALRQSIIDDAPHPFNPDSPKQLAGALFNDPEDDPPGLGLKVVKRGKTGPSTDIEVLEKLSADPTVTTDIPNRIVEYRQLTKLVNTYLVALTDAINEKTGRVHASFHQAGTATGRLSSSDPNLQNIPIRTEVGREIRRAFRAKDDFVLLTADYSQIELRILAHLSGDEGLIEAFRRGEDIHTAVAAEVFGVAKDDVDSAQRNSAKMVNFGIVYGITPFGLARRLGPDTPVSEAERIITEYKARFPRITEFLDACVQQATEKGYVETMMKRRRAVPEVMDRNPQRRALGERTAINTVVQGSAADLIKLAMIDLHQRMPAVHPDVRLLLQIHDELVFETPAAEAEAVGAFVAERMEAAMDLRVPLKVGVAWSETWIEAK
ncbi:MAG: DNA polymerase I [Planctomycetota bacterium]